MKRGDRVRVSCDGKEWTERIYLTTIEGHKTPVVAVSIFDEEAFEAGEKFDTTFWEYVKPLPQVVPLTMQDIEELVKEKYGEVVVEIK